MAYNPVSMAKLRPGLQNAQWYYINESGHIVNGLPSSIKIGIESVEVFIGYPTSESEGFPHGPLYFRYWEMRAVYSTITQTLTIGRWWPESAGYTYPDYNPRDVTSYVWIPSTSTVTFDLLTQTVTGPYYVALDPTIETDAGTGQTYVNLSGRISTPYVPDIDGLNNSFCWFGSLSVFGDCVGLTNIASSSGIPSPSSYPKFSECFPAFDMSDEWYQQIDIVTVTSGTTTTQTLYLSDLSLDGPFVMSSVYAPLSGYKLYSQSGSERVWQRTNASGGTDSVTITLSNEISNFSDFLGWTGTENGVLLDFGQLIFLGLSQNPSDVTTYSLRTDSVTAKGTGTATAIDPATGDTLSHTYDTAGSVVSTYTYQESNGKALFLNPDGTLSFNSITIPGGTDNTNDYSGGGKLVGSAYAVPGSIFLAVGLFDLPILGYNDNTFANIFDYLAEV